MGTATLLSGKDDGGMDAVLRSLLEAAASRVKEAAGAADAGQAALGMALIVASQVKESRGGKGRGREGKRGHGGRGGGNWY